MKFYIKTILFIVLIFAIANQIPSVRKKKREFINQMNSRFVSYFEEKYNLKCNLDAGNHSWPRYCNRFNNKKIILDFIKNKFKKKKIQKLPVLHLNIKQKDFIEIKKLRDKFAKEKEVKKEAKIWFSAKILFNNMSYKIKIRLKGDATDHLNHKNKWSFRIEVKGEETINGFRIFSIQHPKTRAYLDDVFYSEMMQRNNILSPRMYFANVYINGDSIGIMQVEEFFSKELLESQGRKEGLILKSDDLFLSKIEFVKKEDGYQLFKRRGSMEVVQRDLRVLYPKNDSQKENLKRLIGLFTGLREGKIKLNQLFEIDVIARYFAISQVIGSDSDVNYYHALMWHNVVMYYNPIVQKIELISQDNNVSALDFSLNNIMRLQDFNYGGDFIDMFLANEEFNKLFEKYIIEISEEILNTDKYDDVYKLINDYYYVHLKGEFPYLKLIDIDQFKKRVKFVHDYFVEKNKNEFNVNTQVPQESVKENENNSGWTIEDKKEINKAIKDLDLILRSYSIENSKQNELKVINIFNYPIKITDIYAKNNDKKNKDKEELRIATSLPISIPPEQNNTIFVNYIKPSFEDYTIILEAKIDGIDKVFKHEAVMNYALPATKNPIPVSTVKEQLRKHKFLYLSRLNNLSQSNNSQSNNFQLNDNNSDAIYNNVQRVLRVKQGIWNVNDYIIVPKGCTLKLDKGTTLLFKRDKGIISYGNLVMDGTKKNPIILKEQRSFQYKKNARNDKINVSNQARDGDNDGKVSGNNHNINNKDSDNQDNDNNHNNDNNSNTNNNINNQKPQSWKGIAVLQANYSTDNKEDNKSILNNVKIYNTSGMSHTDEETGTTWQLTGGITFYESDVELNDVSIENNYTEDALNIVNSEFLLNNVNIKNVYSDAFDSDFSRGKIIGGSFKDIGIKDEGDGIDFSGSDVYVENVIFDNVIDKAVSVGEATKLTAKNLTIQNSNIGFASKDGSNLIINGSIIDNTRYCGIMSYNKKPEYSSASIVANDIIFKNVEENKKAFAQKGNSIRLNGKNIRQKDLDVDRLYQTEMKKGRGEQIK